MILRSLAGIPGTLGPWLDRLLPPGCAACGTGVPPGPPLCAVCRTRLPPIPRPLCRRCGGTATGRSDSDGCDGCDPWSDSLPAAASAFRHAPPADSLVHGLKYRGWTALAEVLGEFMVGPARRLAGSRSATLVPVPADPRRLRRRGFNQADLISSQICRRTGMASIDCLERRLPGRRQAGLGRAQREREVRNAFQWRSAADSSGQPLILVDDVLTTGATAVACASAIRDAGGECLGVVTFSRATLRLEEN